MTLPKVEQDLLPLRGRFYQVFLVRLRKVSYLEIIRNSGSLKIEKVNVEVKGFLDIVSYRTGPRESDEKIVASQVIKGELKYSVTLDKDNRPIISDLHLGLESQAISSDHAHLIFYFSLMCMSVPPVTFA